MLKVGDVPVNNIILPASDGNSYSIDMFKGKKLVIYFYPKDDTPGCTVEGKSISSVYDNFKSLGVEVLGVSPDGVDKHLKFIKKHGLKQILLSDTENLLASEFGVRALKKSFGREYMGIIRSTFVINEDGVIIKVYEKVKTEGHGEELLKFLSCLG